jgi:hypothetical protein
MTRDDIEHMVREAGIKTGFVLHMTKWDKATWLFMRRFARLVAAAEREACAKVCDEFETSVHKQWHKTLGPDLLEKAMLASCCAAAIRARGQQ